MFGTELLRRVHNPMNLTRPTALVATGLFLTVLAVPQFRASNRLGASGLPAAIDRVRPAVVQLKFIFTGPSPNIPGRADVSPLSMGALGSGFLVGNGYVITARHVIEGFQSFAAQFGQEYTKKALKIAVQMPVENERASFCGFDYDVVAEDERHDLTLLKARNWPSDQTMRCGPMINGKQTTFKVRGATLSRDIRPREGESVAISGYPLGKNILVTTSGTIASAWDSDWKDIHPPGAQPWVVVHDIADSYLADVHVNGGNSGGPAYSVADGRILGVCVSFAASPVQYLDEEGQQPVVIDNRHIFYNSGLASVVPIKYVIALLQGHGVKWEEREKK